jgi:hypothetical protein
VSLVYEKAREGFLANEITWEAGASVLKVDLVRGYVFAPTHKFRSEVTGAGGTVVATQTLANPTHVNGVADADDVVFPDVPEGAAIPYAIVYQASAVTGGADLPDTEQRLIAFIDRGPGIPVVPNGENINLTWSPGADRILRF